MKGKVILMANKSNSLSHTKWMCKYHIVFIPKYRRKAIYGVYKESIREILIQLCRYKGVEILDIENHSEFSIIIMTTRQTGGLLAPIRGSYRPAPNIR